MKYLLILIVSFSCLSCKVTLVPKYNDSIVSEVRQGAKSTDSLYLKMSASPDKAFATFVNGYNFVYVQINSILLKEQSRTKAAQLISMATRLQEHFIKYMNDHKDRLKLTYGELIAYNNDLKAFWMPLLIAETSLNHK